MVSEKGKIHNISPTNVRLLGLARLQNLSSIQKKKNCICTYQLYTEDEILKQCNLQSNMKYLGKKIINGCERPAYWKLKTLVREIKDLNKWRNILCVLIRRLSTIKKAIPFKLNCRVNEISIKIPAGIFAEIGKLFLKFRWKCRDQDSQSNSVKEEQSWRTKDWISSLIINYSYQYSELLRQRQSYRSMEQQRYGHTGHIWSIDF